MNLIKKNIPLYLLSSVFCLLSSISSFSQPINSRATPTKKNRIHSPMLAMVFSTCVPGLGQAYNKKYWKIPIVYATMGTTLYFFDYNNKLYRKYKQAYLDKTDTDSSTIDYYPDYSAQQLSVYQDDYRRFRDLNVILTALFYTINIVDAYVDAQMGTFDVSDDLSLHVSPTLNFYSLKQKPSAGLTLSLRF
ncbi:MAG: DUF5683 domain-containing protein [Bacteroidota bacterium]